MTIRESVARLFGGRVRQPVAKAAYSAAEFDRIFDLHLGSNVLADYGSVGDPYQTNGVVYAAIRKKAVNIAGVEWQILNSADEPTFNTQITRLFDNPYPGVSKYEFWEAIVSSLELYGKAYVVYSDYLRGLPLGMWVANAGHMKIERGSNGMPEAFVYGNGSTRQTFAPQDVMFLHYWHPSDQWDGLAPITAARLDVLQMFHANQYNVNFFRQGGLLKGFFKSTAPRALTPEQEKELERSIQQRGGGPGGAHRVPVFSGVEYVPVGIPQKDMEFLAGMNHNMDYILMVLGVPKAILGFTDGFNYANMREIRKDFWNKSLVPIMHLIEAGFESQFFNRFRIDAKGAFNIKGIAELQEDLAMQAVTAKAFYDMGVPFAVINERLGLDFPEFEPEDRTPPQLLPYTLPAEDRRRDEDSDDDGVEQMPSAKDIAKELRAQEKAARLERRRARERALPYSLDMQRKEWAASAKRMKAREDTLVPRVRAFFSSAHGDVLSYLKENPAKGLTAKKDVVDPEWLKAFVAFLSSLEWGKALLKEVEPEIVATFMSGAMRTYWGIGVNFNMPPERALAFVGQRGLKLRDATDEVVRALTEGIKDGMAPADVAKHVQSVFDNCSKIRSKLIARTETTNAYNGGRITGMRELGIKRKRWVNSGDDNVRDSHRIYNEEAIAGIDEPFRLANGVKVMYPGDGPASEACNCRCTLVSVIE